MNTFFTFFYVNKKKGLNRENIRLSVFDGFTCLKCLGHDLLFLESVWLCDTHFCGYASAKTNG